MSPILREHRRAAGPKRHLRRAALACCLSLLLPVAGPMASQAVATSTADYQAAFTEALPLAEAGDVRAQVQIGRYYLTGQGVAPDPGQAARWFRAAAEAGRVEGMKWLADLYFSGTGVDRDDRAGLAWLQRAAQTGDTDARFLLGKLYWQGGRTPQDPVAAWAWLRLAADKTPQPGSREAARLLPQVDAVLSDAQRREAQDRAAAGNGGGSGADLGD